MEDIIIIGMILVISGLAGWYIIKAKKSGKKCIGCPDGCNCSADKEKQSCSCGGCERR